METPRIGHWYYHPMWTTPADPDSYPPHQDGIFTNAAGCRRCASGAWSDPGGCECRAWLLQCLSHCWQAVLNCWYWTPQTKNQNNPIYTSLGAMDATQLAWLQGELNAAQTANELVIVMSHHRLQDFSDVSPVSASSVQSLLASYDNMILHVTGHGHQNTKVLQTVTSVGSYWELMTAAPIDFPMQSRIIEIVDDTNGYLSIYVTNFDHNSEPSSLAHKARELAAAKISLRKHRQKQVDVAAFWAADKSAQNLLLRVAIPAAVSAALAGHTWPAFIESEETLNTF